MKILGQIRVPWVIILVVNINFEWALFVEVSPIQGYPD